MRWPHKGHGMRCSLAYAATTFLLVCSFSGAPTPETAVGAEPAENGASDSGVDVGAIAVGPGVCNVV